MDSALRRSFEGKEYFVTSFREKRNGSKNLDENDSRCHHYKEGKTDPSFPLLGVHSKKVSRNSFPRKKGGISHFRANQLTALKNEGEDGQSSHLFSTLKKGTRGGLFKKRLCFKEETRLPRSHFQIHGHHCFPYILREKNALC